MKQLKFENLLPEELSEIVPIRIDGLQPRKIEELLPDDDIMPDTYMIYPTGGYHPFYGVPNTLPIYQLPVWPYVKRIKFSERYLSKKAVDNVRRSNLRKNHTVEQVNPYWDGNYFALTMGKNQHYIGARNTEIGTINKKEFRRKKISQHKLVALAFIPNSNPEKDTLVLHLNGDPTNYLIENLKWGTQSENMKGTANKRPDTMEEKYLDIVNKGLIKG